MKRAIAVVASCLIVACTPSADQADTMSLGAVDTLKPAPDSLAAPGAGPTSAATPAAGMTQSRTTAATQSKTGTKTAPVDTTNLGRARAIPNNPKYPMVRLPTVYTTTRPPGGA